MKRIGKASSRIRHKVKMKVKVSQSCPALFDPMDYTVHWILQARILEWKSFPFPGDLPNPVIEPRSPTLQVDSFPAEPQEKLKLKQGAIKKSTLYCSLPLFSPSSVFVLSCFSHVWLFATLWTVAHRAPLSMGILQARTLVGCHALLQGIFPTQGSNPGLPHCRWILSHLSHQASPQYSTSQNHWLRVEIQS